MNKIYGLIAGVILSGTVAAVPADASYLFGSTDYGSATLTFDGITSFTSFDTGWIEDTGAHNMTNNNYFVGTFSGNNYNDYFSFNLGAAAPVSPYSTAVLTIQNGSSSAPYPFTYSLFDVSATPAQLDANRASGDATGQMLYADLGSGTLYGSTTINAATTAGTSTTINLNQAFLSRVNSGLLQNFAIGGTISPSVAAVPEPASWAMMIFGMGAAGIAMRRRQKVTTRVAYAV